ncbi:MAG TPA: methylated-DNA--[protein]-cysteine S-methyltransferase [Candidatus Micrarchaeia archaeon]|nr:methylated-DNA--[protein]-cysteine S-methyltransferase [Candidatus Micrarchaeia archaeon]
MIHIRRDLAAAACRLPVRPPAGLDDRWRDSAQASGAVDVAYHAFDTPLGRLLAAVTRVGLVRLAFIDHGEDRVLRELSVAVSPRLVELPSRLASIRRELEAYGRGRIRAFDVACDWQLIRGFAEPVLRATGAIAYGEVSTYAAIARAAGVAGAARAAGNALARNPIPIIIPCHRVLRTGGGLGGYAGGLERKRLLLRLEGHELELD